MTEDLRQRLAALRADFIQRLPERLAEVVDVVERARHGNAPVSAACHVVHRLHGVTGSYGLADVSRVAAALEALLDGEPTTHDREELWARATATLDTLRDAVRHAMEDAGREA